jgi:DNA-binding response OmpR family regulator
MRILVADDDSEMRDLIATILRQDGHEVHEAPDGAAVLEALRSSSRTADLLISDVEMPRGTGLQVLASVRRTHPLLPVVLITAFGSPELHREARRLGAAATLDKPFGFGELRGLVRTVIGRKDAEERR